MRLLLTLLLAAILLFTGCKKDDSANTSPDATSPGNPEQGTQISGSTSPDSATSSGAAGTNPAALPTPSGSVPIENGVASLEPANTQVQFIGEHAAPAAPDPRLGQFEKFSGTIEVSDNKLQSIAVEIDSDSLVTQIGSQLTTHLKSSDFLDVREYPTISFKSTKIDQAGDAAYNVTGELTLHGTTKTITFPANVKLQDNQLQLSASFKVKRLEFGISFDPKRVVDDVTINVIVGTPTGALPAAAGFGGGGRGPGAGRGPGGGGFDPEGFFARMDTDADGKLTGDEIPQFMRDDLPNADKDSDGAVSKEEFIERGRELRAAGGGAANPPPAQPTEGTESTEGTETTEGTESTEGTETTEGTESTESASATDEAAE